MRAAVVALFAFSLVAGCGDHAPPPPSRDAATDGDVGGGDAARPGDDAGAADSGAADAGDVADAGSDLAAGGEDAGTIEDAGTVEDAAAHDAGGGGDDAGTPAPDCTADLLGALKAIPGVAQLSEKSTTVAGYRFFTMTFDQPADHQLPAGARFPQRISLMHRDCAAPVVVYNSGYSISSRGSRSELTRLVNGNQLSMEHRFFAASRPAPTDWSKLVIAQAAADQHRVIAAFKGLYRDRKWLTTGASKGGMTSVFHRRFYPDDVDGTVAYVAPLDYAEDAVQGPNNRYLKFLENVGGDPACRQRLKDFQRIVLTRRQAMLDRMQMFAMTQMDAFSNPLGPERTLEFATEELPFIFWQYGSRANCGSIPVASASDDAVFDFFSQTATLSEWTDSSLDAFLPYYHQSGSELGYPISDESYLGDLLSYPGQDQPPAYLPAGVPVPAYSDAAMRDVQSWVRSEGHQLLLVYGENDPWSAGAIEIGAAQDSFRFFVAGGNHGSSVAALAAADKKVALDAISRWSGVKVMLLPGLRPEEPGPEADLPHRLR
jgi:hypothetical protein